VEEVVSEDAPEPPYLVCRACERRLRSNSLRPLEFFNLAAVHGPTHFLHDDFYDCGPENYGEATTPDEEVEEPDRFPAPTLDNVKGDLERLLDYCMAQRWIRDRQDVEEALAAHDKREMLASLARRVAASAPNPSIEFRAYEVCTCCVGTTAESWVRGRWEGHYRIEVLKPLAQATAACLPFEEGWSRVTAKLEEMDARDLRDSIFALCYFRSPRAVDWMEAHRDRASTDAWGMVAALSRFSWPRAVAWLEAGRPLSHVALAALQGCFYHYSLLSKRLQPVLEEPAPVEKMVAVLNAHAAARDNVPNVRGRVGSIVAALERMNS
jgi:hypothetical protein